VHEASVQDRDGGPDLVDVAVKIELQQIGRIIGRLPHGFSAAIRMAEAELPKVESANKALDRTHWIVRPDIILNPSRKEAGLSPAVAGLECVIRHKPNRTFSSSKSRVLAQPRRANHARVPFRLRQPISLVWPANVRFGAHSGLKRRTEGTAKMVVVQRCGPATARPYRELIRT
jgi:hypothetical protein